MRIIRLTQGYETIVDDDVADLIEALDWSWSVSIDRSGSAYAIRTVSTPFTKPFTLRLHRWVIGAVPGVRVDHRDGNGLHNWRGNLRLATPVQNGANSITARGETGFRGVNKSGDKFRAQIAVARKNLHLGNFATAEEASAAYEVKRRELHGDFAPANRR